MALLLNSTPQSRLAPCQLPVRGAFGVLPLSKSCPRVRGKCRGIAVTKGEWLKDAKCREMFPSVCSLSFTDSSPASGGAFSALYKLSYYASLIEVRS